MGYEGLIISDDFNMKAVSDEYGLGEASRLFLEAGGDIPLICRGEESELEALEYLEKSIRDKNLDLLRVDKAHERILKLKGRFLKA